MIRMGVGPKAVKRFLCVCVCVCVCVCCVCPPGLIVSALDSFIVCRAVPLLGKVRIPLVEL